MAEDFSGHNTGSAVENATNSANPEAGKWVSVKESAGSAVPTVVNEQLAYGNYIYSSRGKTMQFSPTASGAANTVLCLSHAHLPYPCQPEGGFIDGSNEFYTAFILDLSATSTADVQEIFSYYQLSSGVRRGSLFYKLSSDKKSVLFSLQKNPANPSTSWTKSYDLSKPFLIVVKYGHVCINEKNLGHAEFELYVNPNPLKTEEENSALKISASGNESGYDTDMRYINFRQSGKTSMKTGGIRIANSFSQVVRGPDSGLTVDNPPEASLVFHAKGKTLFPGKPLEGELSVYDVSSRLLRTYNMQGESAIETNLGPGVYILLYKGSEAQYMQKILIH
jgi:hypothetical protein